MKRKKKRKREKEEKGGKKRRKRRGKEEKGEKRRRKGRKEEEKIIDTCLARQRGVQGRSPWPAGSDGSTRALSALFS
jgi:hypothetical protein